MPETNRPLKVFLCHAHADREAVRALYSRLVKDGVDAWFDKEKLLPGQDWELEIRKAVREADVVVVCLSKQFNQAGFRQKEVRLALDTAMEKPEGEIFIIPARLEECDNLESLRKWHVVDLFEENGSELLMRALRVQANKVGIEIEARNKKTTITETISSSPLTTVVGGLNWATVSPSTIFYGRMCDAFPGLRGSEKFIGEEAVNRLSVLLREPLSVNLGGSFMDGQITPIWWTRGRADMYVNTFEILGRDRVLIDNLELHIERIIAVREYSDEERNFVYVQTLPDKPTGLYKYSENRLQDYMQERLKNNWGYYYFEEYGLWNGKAITRQEYDDGATVINGKPERVSGAQLRLKYITPYNFILCGGDHVLLRGGGDLINEATILLDGLLLGKITFTDWVSFVDGLPSPKRYNL